MISDIVFAIISEGPRHSRGVKTHRLVGECAKPFLVTLAVLSALRLFEIDVILENYHVFEIFNRGANVGREKMLISFDFINALYHTLAYFAVLGLSKGDRKLGSMYFWSPLTYIAALDGYTGALCNAALCWALVLSRGRPFGAGMLFSVCIFFHPWTFVWILFPILLASISIDGCTNMCQGGKGKVGSRSSQQFDLRWRILQCLKMSLGILLGIATMYWSAVILSNINISHTMNDASEGVDVGLLGYVKSGWQYMLQQGRDFSTIEPTMDLYWYLMAEVFPSFRKYFADSMFIVGILLSAGICGKFSSYKITSVFACGVISSMLSSGPLCSLLPLWSVFCLISTKDQTEKRRLYVLFFLLHVSLLLNIVSYQHWISLGLGNANFFYATNILQGAIYGMLLVTVLKMCDVT